MIYNVLRGILKARGPVCFMFVHKVRTGNNPILGLVLTFLFQNAVKDNDSGKLVKFGYVVFQEKGVAQKLLREGSIAFAGGHKIRVRDMM